MCVWLVTARPACTVLAAALRAAVAPQNAEGYLLPKTSPEQPEQWPVLVLEPMFWLLYAVQSMIAMGE